MVDRIQLILKVNNLTASKFADEIGVQRSSISHILSGRNMPSLDFIQKILKRFPEIDPEWLLNGKNTMMKNPAPDLFNMPESTPEVFKEALEKKEETLEIKPVEIPLFIDKQESKQEIVEPEASEIRVKSVLPDQLPEFPSETGLKSDKPRIPQEETLKDPIKESKKSAELGVKIEKIVIFYSNRTFREYFPE